MDTASLPIFLVYFVEGTFLVLCDPVDGACGQEKQLNSITISDVHTVTKQLIQQVSLDLLTEINHRKANQMCCKFKSSHEMAITHVSYTRLLL